MDANQPKGNLMQKFSHPLWLAWLALALAGGYYLLTRHEQHVAQLLPYLVFLACPLMHIFMHGGHRGHGAHHHHGEGPKSGTDGPTDG